MDNKWNDIVQSINEFNNIVILTHTNMDGDALGSSSALCAALRLLGKKVVILLEDDIPHYLSVIVKHKDFFVEEMPFDADLAIVVDCGDETRIEKRIDTYNQAKRKLCIDHHVQTKPFADIAVVEPNASATGILIYELIKELGLTLTQEIAEYLYVAISTDTGSFKYHNADARAHLVIADLYNFGIDHSQLCMAIYSTFPIEQLKLEALAVDNAEIFAGGKAVISYVTNDMIKSVGAKYEMVDTCIDRVRCIEGTEIACMVKEFSEGVYKASFRSKYYADVNKVAAALGGGGHIMASGCTLNCSLEEALAKIKREIEKAL